MDYNEFLVRIIDEGIDAAKKDYKEGGDKLDGSIAGFEACRNKLPEELKEVYKDANEYVRNAFIKHEENYWYFRCYQAEVEWVMNVVSAMLYNQGLPPLMSHFPTCNAMMKAASIIGVKAE